MTTPASPLSVQDFASRIRAKYPGAYDSLPDQELAQRVVAKHPEYQGKVSLTPSQGEAPEGFWHSFGSQIAGMLNAPAPNMPIMPQAAASMANDFMTAARQSQRPISPETGLPIPDPTGNLRNLHTAAALLSPVGGGSLEKFLEQTESGNLKGAAGTGLGIAAPFALGAKASPKPGGAVDPFVSLPRAEALVKAREIIHDGLTRQVMQPAQTELGTALAKARVPEVDAAHPLYDLTNAKTGKQFVEALRNEETAGILDRSLRDLGKSGDLDPQFREKWLAASKKPFDFVTAAKPGRNARGVFSSIMSQPGWAMVGMELGGLAGKALGIPFVGRALGASKLAEIGTTREGMGLARDMLSKMPPETESAAPAATPAAPAVDPAAARANALMRARNPEMFGQPAMAPDQRAARIAQILQEAKGSEGGLAERRTASAPVQAPTTPKPTVDTAELVSVGRNLGMRTEEAQARAQEAIAQFPNDQNAAIQYMAGRKAPVASTSRAVSVTPAGPNAPLITPASMGFSEEEIAASMARHQAPGAATATKPVSGGATPAPVTPQTPAEISPFSLGSMKNYSVRQADVVGSSAGAVQDTAFFQQAKAELGEKASVSDIARRAQELKTNSAPGVVANPQFVSPRQRSSLAKNQKQMAGFNAKAALAQKIAQARQAQLAGEGVPLKRPATAEEQAWTDAMANFGILKQLEKK